MPRYRRLALVLLAAIAAFAAFACTTTDDEQEEQQAAAAAPVAQGTAEVENRTPQASSAPAGAAPRAVGQRAGNVQATSSAGSAVGAGSAAATVGSSLEAAVLADFAAFSGAAWAGLPTSANHVIAWGIGAPLGDDFLIPVRIYDTATGAMLREAAIGGGPLRSSDAVRVAIGDSPIGTLIEAHGETGAHGVTYDVLTWDGVRLLVTASEFSDVPGNAVAPGAAGRLEDLDGDGIPEVIADRTDGYPFWYSSQVWRGDAAVLRWNGYEFTEVALELDEAMGPGAAEHTRAAIALAEAGWLREAASRTGAARDADPGNGTAVWNHLLLQTRADAAAGTAAGSPLAWAGAAVNGDWEGAVDLLRNVGSKGLLSIDAALANSTLDGDRELVIAVLRGYAEAAIEGSSALLSDAERAPAWLILGLTKWWGGRGYDEAEDSLLEAIPGYWDETFLFDLMYYMRIAE